MNTKLEISWSADIARRVEVIFAPAEVKPCPSLRRAILMRTKAGAPFPAPTHAGASSHDARGRWVLDFPGVRFLFSRLAAADRAERRRLALAAVRPVVNDLQPGPVVIPLGALARAFRRVA